MDDRQIFAAIADERRQLAALLDTFTPDQWATDSLCQEWTVRDVAAHLLMPLITPALKFILAMAKALGNFDKANLALTGDVAHRHGQELAELLRAHADSLFTPPGHGPLAPLTDVIIHGQDIRRPLHITRTFDPERQLAVLSFLTSPTATRGFARKNPQLCWETTDLDWSNGEGPVVHGPAEALMLVLAGRDTALTDISGDGAEILRTRAER
ncbi:MAG: maleylpyruvate isomerase family mycothiol-dependent enzyme [Mycolicibacterium sp.]|uniref:maleylpyruvate isomerase family mycothiol-dependent enzyme n=1 Tax=Mycolicibacterium sp. TaxID=2320850 RepID=UPI000FA4DE7B|nr:maleylpyruvate isomerase family mycothiol-dependent enzyme [Mycolicibacterium sp.]RUP26244.1 MAG: maleylpyruvate isomerase family mycothiol-dependent enzyme [Mycolicibacterium sp.]